ncbi:hypothetical protein P7K49_023430 [Saguinus oedipus]|uniref:C2H2-type domain-containing protein n=1 Tax=Saguinus oedipus TaxID=9490 RepID=A0ABQ9ULQ8_SAGOE|nr:hypothetical protein P7K49_023430 [Saguinus oedipus]
MHLTTPSRPAAPLMSLPRAGPESHYQQTGQASAPQVGRGAAAAGLGFRAGHPGRRPESRSGGEETSVWEKCCTEFFKWADLLEHQRSCPKVQRVLIVHEDAPAPPAEDFVEPSPANPPSERAKSEAA